MTKITKAIIPCAGMGTRFMPITKALPKELLPIIDTPVLSYIVDEAVESGITDVLIITSPKKEVIKRYFLPDNELYDRLESVGKTELVKKLKDVHNKVNVSFAYQTEPKGSGHAVLQAKSFTGDEPFCLAFGDDLICAQEPVMKQLINAYDKTQSVIIGMQKIFGDEIVKYGVGEIVTSDGRLHELAGIVEKPALNALPSRIASLGRYVLTKDVYKAIEETPRGKNNEYQITDALNLMCKTSKVYAYEFEGKRYDMGDKFGSMQAQTEYALKNADFGEKYKEYLKELAKTL